MQYTTEQIIAMRDEANQMVADLEAQRNAAQEDANKSGLEGTAGQDMQALVQTLTTNLEEAKKIAQDVEAMAEEKVRSQQASDAKVAGYTSGN